jgi:hypothetical protein
VKDFKLQLFNESNKHFSTIWLPVIPREGEYIQKDEVLYEVEYVIYELDANKVNWYYVVGVKVVG